MDEISSSTCRLCLSEIAGDGINIFEFSIGEGEKLLKVVLQICEKISISEDDIFPKYICDTCLETVSLAKKLSDVSAESEWRLKNQFSFREESGVSVVKQEIVEEGEVNFEITSLVEVKCDIDDTEVEHQNEEENEEQNSGSDDQQSTVAKSKKKSNSKKHQCKFCLKLFEKPSKLARHIQTHDPDKKPFACEVEGCFQRFLTDASLKRHGIIHQMTIKVKEQKTYECVVCKRHFDMQEALASHMRTHKDVLEKLVFTCEICGENFKKLNDLTRHSRKHPQNKSHKCLICSKMFSQGSHLIDHLNRHQNLRPHVCHVCNKAFQQSSTLKDHLRTHTSEKPFLCSECGKSFNNPSNLRQHVKRHLNLKEFPCHLCPGKFSCKASLDSHIRSHSGIKPHVCSQCGASFTKGSSLKKHVRTIHEGIKPFECEACSMRFNSSEHLKRHFRTHTGEKPYVCDFEGCSRAYAQSNDLLKHKKIHVGELVYKCTICTDAFRLQSQLRDHYKVHYKNDKNESSSTDELK